MKFDVVKFSCNYTSTLVSFNGITRFKKEYSHWFRDVGEMYMRYIGKNHVGSWRYVPNKSIDFYRCEKITDSSLIEKLNKLINENPCEGCDEEYSFESGCSKCREV